MNILNLKTNYQSLLDFMKEKEYSDGLIYEVKRCIRMVLNDGISSEIGSYEELFLYEVDKLGFDPKESRYNLFKVAFGHVWNFDVNGLFPRGRGKRTGFMSGEGAISSLPECYRTVLAAHRIRREAKGITRNTIEVEQRAGVVFFTHLQRQGAMSFCDVTPQMVYSFFFDGETTVRGASYAHTIRVVMQTAVGINLEESSEVLRNIPHVKSGRKIFDYLKPEEAASILKCLEDPCSPLSMQERAVGWILFFLGLRGSDIAKLSLNEIDWKQECINLVQSKTGRDLTLPLNAAVGNAIFDYITQERPSSDSDKVFIKASYPFDGYKNVSHIMNNVLKVAGVRTDGGTKGVRLMRHHLVSTLLNLGVDCATVSTIVGHSHKESLTPYVDVDFEQLKSCSIDISEYPLNPELLDV